MNRLLLRFEFFRLGVNQAAFHICVPLHTGSIASISSCEYNACLRAFPGNSMAIAARC